MSIQQNFPAISPSLNLNFARSKTLDPRITFSRTSTATRVNEQGLVEVVSADIPRFDHEYDASTGVVKSLGLLVEEQRTNFIKNGTSFDANWGNNDPTVGSGNAAQILTNTTETLSPDGTNNAAKIIQANNGWQRILQGVTLDNNNRHTFSIFVKQGNSDMCVVEVTGNFSAGGRIQWNFNTETFTEYSDVNWANLKYEKYPNGWYRLSGDFLATSISGTSGAVWFFPGDDYNGVPTTPASYTYVYGYQLEEGAFPTSYIPTSGSTATREPDSVTMTGDNFSDWYNQEQGSFLWIGNVYSREISPVQPFRVNQGANLRGLGIQFDTRSANNSTSFVSRTQTSNIPGKVGPSGIIPSDNKIKIAGGYIESVGLSTIRAAFNGLPEDSYTGSSQTDITYDTMYEIEIMGNRGISGTNNQFTGVCEQLVYYPRILSDDQLQNLTK